LTKKHISTSYVERQNLTMRMAMRRFARLTNAFPKKLENHIAAISLHFMHYNFCRIHQTIRVTGDGRWRDGPPLDIDDIAALQDADHQERKAERAERNDGHEPAR
jgi:hypothetical protein